MSDGFPSHSCAAAILSHGEVVEGAGRFLVSRQVSGRGHKMSRISDSVVPGAKGLVDNDEGGVVDCCAET